MRARIASLAIALLAAALLAPAGASAEAAPAWKLTITPAPANFTPGGKGEYALIATNVGAREATAPFAFKATLPAPLELVSAVAKDHDPATTGEPSCTVEPLSGKASCVSSEPLGSGHEMTARFRFEVPSGASPETIVLEEARIEGGGANTVSQQAATPIQPDPVPFDFLEGESGLSALFGGEDGTPSTTAAGHPYQLTLDVGFPSEATEDSEGVPFEGRPLTGAGHVRDLSIEMPRGLSGDPAALTALCSVATLTSQESAPPCPDASQVGIVKVVTQFTEGVSVLREPLYAMVPEPGAVAQFGFQVASAGIYVYPAASVRTDGDYGVSVTSEDVLAFGANPIFDVNAQVWGDPTSGLHDKIRGHCVEVSGSCPLEEKEDAFLTMPGDCPGAPLRFSARADSWEEKGVFHEASYESPAIQDCGALDFKPTIEARPTTTLADSPSGLDVDVHQPQELKKQSRYTSALKDLSITFPAGLQVNASAAAGQGVCTTQQIGLTTQVGEAPHFTAAPASCPDSAKLGTVEAITPLLAQRKAEGLREVEVDPETHEPIPEPLRGSLYLAKPFENPFGSLIAVYLTIEDPTTGIFAKLASEVTPDPVSGQLSTTLTESPDLPVEDVHVHVFGGARGSLQTPPSCGSYTTTSHLVPWSAPEGKATDPTDSFTVDQAAGGGPCPLSEPNSPSFSAGTVSPQAAKYSPMALKISRSDGSQRLVRFEATLPPGLTARLAGAGECSGAQIAAASARSHPNEGAAEQQSPSCPASSEIGTIDAAAGAGPTPLHVPGRLYLAGPYEGAPYSVVAITPAIAGPFDLGVVVVRSPVYIDPVTGQARLASDPFPQILDGIPVDLRSVSAFADRPSFTLNPTNCDQLAFVAATASTLGQVAPLKDRFQVGGCKSLPYKPKLSARLFGPTNRGAHPRLKAVFKAKPGEANTARISFTLPHSEFIDQAHFRTICTRVQFAAAQCPKGAIYGHVKATTPLLDYPLEGPIYLRSSSHELPDVVLALRGPPAHPVEVDLDGRVDSVNGGLRTIFEGVPDLPATKAIVTMQGAKKGLFQNSTNLCKEPHRATLQLDGQNGKPYDTAPELKVKCPKPKAKHGKGHGRRHHHG
jgi:hypothetical protein